MNVFVDNVIGKNGANKSTNIFLILGVTTKLDGKSK